MTYFIPPYPKRHKKSLNPLKILQLARKDLLSIWGENAFRFQFIGIKIFNRSVFIANCPQVIKHVFITNHSNYERKSTQMRNALEPLLGDGLFISDGEKWKKHRDMMSPLFSSEQVAKYSEIMIQVTEEYVQKWGALDKDSTLDVLPEMGTLTAEIICRTLFGNQLGTQHAEEIVKNFAEYQSAIEQIDFTSFFGLPKLLPNLKHKTALKAAQKIHAIIDAIIAKGVTSDNKNTLLAQLLSKKDSETSDTYTTKEIRNELIVLFMAGHETTANTLAWAWYLISQSPDVEQKLHTEVDTILSTNKVHFDDFSKLTYTRAIFDETLRLYPPVPVLSREVKNDDTIRNRHIPAGSIMLVVPWLLHRHERLWDKPNHFIPERFLPDAKIKPEKFTYIPFSAGPRVCIAQFFGTVEATLCLAILAKNFRLTLPAGTKVTHDCRLTLRPKDKLSMQLTPR